LLCANRSPVQLFVLIDKARAAGYSMLLDSHISRRRVSDLCGCLS
jgi:hypothetical protein